MSASHLADLTTDLTIDLSDVLVLIREAERYASTQDGRQIHAGNSTARADARRRLVYVSDTLARAASEAKAQLAVINGFPDVLKEETL